MTLVESKVRIEWLLFFFGYFYVFFACVDADVVLSTHVVPGLTLGWGNAYTTRDSLLETFIILIYR